jgi:hypothetical protein
MRALVLLVLTFMADAVLAQEAQRVYLSPQDSTQNYYVARPPKGIIKGLLVLNQASLSDSGKLKAFEMGVMTVTVIPSSNYILNLTDEMLLNRIGGMIGSVVSQIKYPGTR